jgi:hypothetical protein
LHRQLSGRPSTGPSLSHLAIGELFTHFKGGFYHDGRFATLDAVVDHYNSCLAVGLTGTEKSDLVQHLLSLTFEPQQAETQQRKAGLRID